MSVQLRVIFGDTDAMGVVYHGHYLRYFEAGRTEYLRGCGARYRDLEAEGFLLPVTEANVRFVKPARYDDLVRVETVVAELGRASLRFGYRLVREDDGDLLAVGHTDHACVGRDFRPRRFPESLRTILEAEHRRTSGDRGVRRSCRRLST